MPGAVPGMATGSPLGAPTASPSMGIPSLPLPPPPAPGAPPGLAPNDPSMVSPLPEYLTETQTDGTVLLRIKNPDGSPGPVIRVINGIKPARQ